MWAAPRYFPVGGRNGGWQTKTWVAMLTTQSGSRIWASASDTVDVGPRMITSGVIRPPAVPSSYSSRRRMTSASSSSITPSMRS